MKLKFENQAFQLQAVNSVVDLFLGMQTLDLSQQLANDNEILSFDIVANGLQIEPDKLIVALQNIRQANGLNELGEQNNIITELYYGEYTGIPNFSVEMETGTGKTYVYLRTILELNKCYGLTKFIIVVPSDAIRIGTLKSLEITQAHFKSEFDNVNYDYYAYNSSKTNKVRDFATTNTIQIMVMSIASFNKDIEDNESKSDDKKTKKGNVIFEFKDRYGEYRPIDLICATNPAVIIDEPQSVDNTINAKNAIKKLNPLFILRYSATHKETYNLVYKLDAIDAYNKHLVKQIEVASIEDVPNPINTEPYLKVINIVAKKASVLIDLELDVIAKGKMVRKIIKNISKGTNLQNKTNNDAYSGYIVEDFSLDNGLTLNILDYDIAIGTSIGGNVTQELKTNVMLRLVISNHIKRELKLAEQNIKILSLFFIDKVADYRAYDNEHDCNAWLAKSFIQQLKEELNTSHGKRYIELCKSKFAIDLNNDTELSKLHDGYFAKDNKGHYKDSKENTQDAIIAYNLIMKEKEKLLNPQEPLRFIFSHSALKEGWDNPNVFQVCVLQDSTNIFKRRQQIGRGLRLCVNSNGERITDKSINTLIVVAGESFNTFAQNLQNEYEIDANIKFKDKLPINKQIDRIEITLNERVYNGLDGNFKRLWHNISTRTIYTASLDSEVLIKSVVDELSKKLNSSTIQENIINIQRNQVKINNIGIHGSLIHSDDIKINTNNKVNVVAVVAEMTSLTHKTIIRILQGITPEQLSLLAINTNSFISIVSNEINLAKNKLLVAGIKYRKYSDLDLKGVLNSTAYHYAQSLFNRLDHGYKDYITDEMNIIDINYDKLSGVSEEFKNKFLYNVLRFDSKIEIEFLIDCLARNDVKTITKLPNWFKVNTPLGKYNPDWALLIQKDGNEEIYFIAETKGEDFDQNGRLSELAKVKCGEKHFTDTLGISYKHGSNVHEILN